MRLSKKLSCGNDLLKPLMANGLMLNSSSGLIMDFTGNSVAVQPNEVTEILLMNLGGILGGIYALNDDVTIYINNLYSPFKYIEGYEDMKGLYIPQMNQAISQAAMVYNLKSGGVSKCRVVDVYSSFAKHNSTSNPAVHTISQQEALQARSIMRTIRLISAQCQHTFTLQMLVIRKFTTCIRSC